MARYECSVCGYVYDEDQEGQAWADLPEGWTCPRCSAAKSSFASVDESAGLAGSMPRAFVQVHRAFGYVFLAVYLFFLWQMVPRLWSYQIELPARTVVHLALGIAIGPTLLLKILIVRFFRRLDAALVPLLGTMIFVGSVVVIGISAPFALHQAVQRRAAGAEGIFSADSLQRVRTLLAQAGFEEAESTRLATADSLRAGRRVLRQKCTACHDLRTVLAKPRTPESWRQTVRRMADRTTTLAPLDEEEQRLVTAYLVAISPQLQQSAQKMRTEEELGSRTKEAMDSIEQRGEPSARFDVDQAKQVFEKTCSQCHGTEFVDTAPPGSADEARSLVARMVEAGLTATEEELADVVQYLTVVYVETPGE